jgi:hypothetical protein
MTWSMHVIGWLELGENAKATALWNQSWEYAQYPFYVWSEKHKGQGASNFVTGAGGLLQSILFGYAGSFLFRLSFRFLD